MLQSKSSCAVCTNTGAFGVAVAPAAAVATSGVSCESAFELTILFSDIIKPRCFFLRGCKNTKIYAYYKDSISGPTTPFQVSPTIFWNVQTCPNGSSNVPCL